MVNLYKTDYLDKPTGPSIQDFLSQKDAQKMVSKYGRFWFNKDSLYYRTTQGYDIHVENIEIGKCISQECLIVRMNGIIIPTITLEQLKILLRYYGQNTIYSNFYEKISI